MRNHLAREWPVDDMMRDGETVVVDFKFGKPDRKYPRQVQTYLDLLIRMGTNPATTRGYLWYVDDGKIEEINKK